VYQGGIRVPLFFRWPAQVQAGRSIDRIAAHIDVLPTLLEACGVARRGPAIDGRSLMPLLRGNAAGWPDRTLFTQWHRGDEPQPFRDCAARTQRYKLVNGKELYDLAEDPAESSDIAGKRPEIAARLRKATGDWFRDVSSTRGYAPPRIALGTPQENPVILTRQDWRGARAGWDGKSLGHWEVDVAAAGRYEVTLRMDAAEAGAAAAFRLGRAAETAPLKAGETACRFTVALEKGPGRLEAEIGTGSAARGVNYVEARKI
jgi:hypothetical protein